SPHHEVADHPRSPLAPAQRRRLRAGWRVPGAPNPRRQALSRQIRTTTLDPRLRPTVGTARGGRGGVEESLCPNRTRAIAAPHSSSPRLQNVRRAPPGLAACYGSTSRRTPAALATSA